MELLEPIKAHPFITAGAVVAAYLGYRLLTSSSAPAASTDDSELANGQTPGDIAAGIAATQAQTALDTTQIAATSQANDDATALAITNSNNAVQSEALNDEYQLNTDAISANYQYAQSALSTNYQAFLAQLNTDASLQSLEDQFGSSLAEQHETDTSNNTAAYIGELPSIAGINANAQAAVAETNANASVANTQAQSGGGGDSTASTIASVAEIAALAL
jgi:hypothetical protein